MDSLIWPITVLIFATVFIFLFRKEIGKFIGDITWLRTNWFELRRIQEEVFAKAEEVKKLSEELKQDKQELREATRIFIELVATFPRTYATMRL